MFDQTPTSPEKVIILDFDVPVTNMLTALFTGSAFELNPLMIGIMQNICKASGAKLVCSSNRADLNNKARTVALLTKAGFDCDQYLHADWSCNYKNTSLAIKDKKESAAIRTENIEQWLTNHPEVTVAVAIDDLELSVRNFVHIKNIHNGITFEDVQKICHFLEVDLKDVAKAANPKANQIKFPTYEP